MRIIVMAKTRAKETKVIKVAEDTYRVLVTAVPADGRANAAIIKALAKYLKITPSRLCISRGATSKRKYLQYK